MRLLGFVGIFFLALFNMLGMFISIQNGHWKGIVFMTLMAGMLVFFTRTLWRGRRLERIPRPYRETDDWFDRPLSRFFADQVAKSPEGRIFLAGSAVSLLLGFVSLAWPAILHLSAARAGGTAVLFIFWPIIAFLLYVQVCGPSFGSSTFKRIVMVAVMCAPAYFPYM